MAREPAHRVGIVGGVLDGLGQQGQCSDGCLQLVADVRDEVPADLFHPAALGLILGQHQDQALTADVAAERGDPDREGGHPAVAAAAYGHLELALADLTVAAYLPRQREQLAGHQALAVDQAVSSRRVAGPQHAVFPVKDHRRRRQDRKHGGDARRQSRVLQ